MFLVTRKLILGSAFLPNCPGMLERCFVSTPNA